MADHNNDSTGSVTSQQFVRQSTARVIGRRYFLGGAALAGFAAATCAGGSITRLTPPTELPQTKVDELVVKVCDFGERGDGRKDNTAAFQKALDAAHSAGGGSVYVPAGKYLFKGHLDLPSATALVGSYAGPPSGFFGQVGNGTVLLPTEGRGKPDGTAFITAGGASSTIRGLAIYYPEQLSNALEPTPYPWTIENTPRLAKPEGDGAADLSIIDVNISNAYQGISLATRHYISRVYGRPIHTGIFVDQCTDVGRIENVHFVWSFWPEANANPHLLAWMQNHGTAFRFGRSDEECVLDTFCFQYHTGYHFVQTPSGSCYGTFLGIGADTCHCPVQIDSAEDVVGLHITNGQFAAYLGDDTQGFVIGPKNTGAVNMSNCAFWGGGDLRHFGTVQGSGVVNLIGCNFYANWDPHNQGEPAILCDGPAVTISNCLFRSLPNSKKTVARITNRCAGAVIMGNTSQGTPFNIVRPGKLPKSRFQIHSNIAIG